MSLQPRPETEDESTAKRVKLSERQEDEDEPIVDQEDDEIKYEVYSAQNMEYAATSRVNIDVYASPRSAEAALRGTVKALVEDFLVNEIDSSGNVVYLTDNVSSPIPPEANPPVLSEEPKPTPPPAPSAEEVSPQVLLEKLQSLLLPSVRLSQESLNSIVDAGVKAMSNELVPSFTLSEPIHDKRYRGTFHQAIRAVFRSKLLTQTSREATERISLLSGGGGAAEASDDRNQQQVGSKPPAGSGFYRFTLWKRNLDRNFAVDELSRKSNIPRKAFTYAGTKDKVGCTTQRVSVRCGASSAQGLVRSYVSGGASHPARREFKVSDFGPHTKHMFLGDSKGNRFTLAIRNFHVQGIPALEVLQSLAKYGFVNYFGLQRFGTGDVGTHVVGTALLERDWSKASSLILQPRQRGEDELCTRVRIEYQLTRDADKFLAQLPRRLTAERCLAKAYNTKGHANDHLGALLTIPRNLLTLYTHAAQSWIWNAIASERIRVGSAARVCVGDLVVERSSGATSHNQDTTELSPSARVTVVTAENAHAYAPSDVVLPLPGYGVQYPVAPGWNRDAYQAKAVELGITRGLPGFQNTSQSLLSLPGGYRRILVVPTRVKARIHTLSEEEAAGDRPILSGEPNETDAWPAVLEADPEDQQWRVGEGANVLLVSFHLPPGVYATMCMRELIRD